MLSETTAAYDRGAKFAAYRKLPSLQEYLLVDIELRRLELFRREAPGWVLHEAEAGADGAPAGLRLESIDLHLTETEVFEDLDEDEPPAA